MDRAITQWINSPAGMNAFLESALVVMTHAGILVLIAGVVVQ